MPTPLWDFCIIKFTITECCREFEPDRLYFQISTVQVNTHFYFAHYKGPVEVLAFRLQPIHPVVLWPSMATSRRQTEQQDTRVYRSLQSTALVQRIKITLVPQYTASHPDGINMFPGGGCLYLCLQCWTRVMIIRGSLKLKYPSYFGVSAYIYIYLCR